MNKLIFLFFLFIVMGCSSVPVNTSEDSIILMPGTPSWSSQNPEQGEAILTGTVMLHIINKGTFSEFKYFTVLAETNIEYLLFREDGKSRNFEEFVNKQCDITGYFGEGTIGFRNNKTHGIYVQSIEIKK